MCTRTHTMLSLGGGWVLADGNSLKVPQQDPAILCTESQQLLRLVHFKPHVPHLTPRCLKLREQLGHCWEGLVSCRLSQEDGWSELAALARVTVAHT